MEVETPDTNIQTWTNYRVKRPQVKLYNRIFILDGLITSGLITSITLRSSEVCRVEIRIIGSLHLGSWKITTLCHWIKCVALNKILVFLAVCWPPHLPPESFSDNYTYLAGSNKILGEGGARN